MPTKKVILIIFDLSANYLVRMENRNRWINVLNELERYEYQDIVDEYAEVKRFNNDNHPLYYLEAVRRNLMIKENDRRKTAPIPKIMKDLMREIFK